MRVLRALLGLSVVAMASPLGSGPAWAVDDYDVCLEMIQTDPVAAPLWASLGTPSHLLAWVGVVLVIGIGKVLTWRMANKSDPA